MRNFVWGILLITSFALLTIVIVAQIDDAEAQQQMPENNRDSETPPRR